MIPASVVAIYLHGEKSGPMFSSTEVLAEKGLGLMGDTYHRQAVEKSDSRFPEREVTLIESEALTNLKEDHGINLDASESRRNVVTRGVRLNSLVGVEFHVGDVRLRGVELCHPCKHLERLTRPGVLKGLAQQGGLRAEVLEGGTIREGSEIRVPSA